MEVGVPAFRKIFSVMKNVFREMELFSITGDLCGVYFYRQTIKLTENKTEAELRKLAFKAANVDLVNGIDLAFSPSSCCIMSKFMFRSTVLMVKNPAQSVSTTG